MDMTELFAQIEEMIAAGVKTGIAASNGNKEEMIEQKVRYDSTKDIAKVEFDKVGQELADAKKP